MNLFLEWQLDAIVLDFDSLIARCNRLGLDEVSKRLQPIRDVVSQGVELRRLVQREAATADKVKP